ncbi:MAG: Response regulator MprA [bacterium ADurb.Bin363]|nr:MAG: Response regulator MprA [bacterium ADurb.Bin363]
MMPEMDGIEFSLQLRDIPFKDDIPVMIVSAKDDFNEISHAYTIGISEYITKPFDPVELIEKVRRILCSD